MMQLASEFVKEPWVILGDFNAIIDASEVSGHSGDDRSSRVDFSYCVRDAGLVHLPFTGNLFTWHNGSVGSLVSVVFTRKMKVLKPLLCQQRKDEGDLHQNVQLAHAFLLQIQVLRQSFRHSCLLRSIEQCCRLVYSKAVQLELCMLKQRSKLQWLKDGEILTAPALNSEIKDALFDIAEDSAPGLDGFSAGFFKAAWAIVGNDFCAVVHKFFISGVLLKQINATLLTLIPKVQMPSKVSDFRPISCCNVIYKVITKILVKRMQPLLTKIIDYSQNAFVPGRNIADNVLLAQELLTRSISTDVALAGLLSLGVIKGVLQGFSSLSGLHANPHKSQLILAKSAASIKHILQEFMGFQEGVLPVKYLRVPLKSSRLSINGCQALLLRIYKRISGWGHLSLSFAARAQLVKFVLSSLHIYWASIFPLPKGVIKAMEAKFRKFLWQGNASSGQSKVSWAQVYLPVEEGGLGIKGLNLGFMGYPIPPQESDHLDMAESKWSCFWKKLINLRIQLLSIVIYNVCDGTKFKLWQDPWHLEGPLILKYPHSPITTGLHCNALLRSVIHEGHWEWPESAHVNNFQFMTQLPTIYPGNDTILWNNAFGEFSLKDAFSLFIPVAPKVSWSIRFSGKFKTQRHNFILWLAILERFSTMDKPWIRSPGVCVLCNGQDIETHSDLFFRCSYLSRCLHILKRRVKFHWPHFDWSRGILWASSKWRSKHLIHMSFRTLLAALVYFIWAERNSRRFKGTARSEEAIAKIVLEHIRLRIISVNLDPSLQRHILFRIWHIAWGS
ncbi:UNVERIFIED_CONTAM: hypothetical protein Slati_3413600 [Sesamum latifolium]|uniref:Reverse transcriptase domain-containing protein n=1 Tax=Sesamum latifolium TaxID=2727402 RepID=A0AAW2UHI2_9LAMI